ncbi:MAG: UvrD-helicase domain-containing protein [Clostridium sp.]|nr:UvrD-helicase domain-containing protein [Clostridium sp.]
MNNLSIYKASAGSGKTFTLAVQYIKLLVAAPGNGTFRHILAVTFTNKATTEMKERILQQLYGLWKGLPSAGDYLKALKEALEKDNITLSDEEISRRAGNALQTILHDYSRFSVETIDAFFQKVLQNLAHELSLTANLQVDLNDTETLGLAVERIMERLHIAPRTLAWITEYVEERLSENSRWDVSGELKSFATEIFKRPYLINSEQLSVKLNDNAFITALRNTLKAIQEEAKDRIISAIHNFQEEMEDRHLVYPDFKNGSTLGTYLRALGDSSTMMNPSKTEFKVTLQKYVTDPMNMLVKTKQALPEWRETAEHFSRLLAEIRQFQLEETTKYNSATLTRKHLNPLRLLGIINEEVTALNNETNRFLLAKTPILLNELVAGTDAPFIFEKMGADFRHVMIDEFQDTSTLQWNNFKKLLIENMSTGQSNLLVGDVKQSIYRWRGGDWKLLNNIETEMKEYQPETISLKTNFRSERRIIQFNNALFPEAARKLDALNPEAELKIEQAYSDVEQAYRPGKEEKGYVRLRFYKGVTNKDSEWEELMLDDLCEQVKALHENGLPYSEMAILLRRNKQATPIIERFALRLPTVKLVSNEAFMLSSSLAVNLIIAAQRCLNDPTDVVSRAYLVIHYQRDVCHTGNDSLNTLLLNDPSSLLPEEFTQKAETLRQLPLYELQEHLYHLFALDRLEGEDAYMLTYLDKVTEYAQSNPTDLKSFLTYWEDTLRHQNIPSGEIDGIRIFTIHKSKGLEFHTVLLPYFDWAVESEDKRNLLWCTPKESPYNALPVIPVALGKNMQDSVYCEEYEEEHLQMRVDALNMMYVAFTRAAKNLYVWGKTKFDFTDKSMVSDLLYATLPVHLPDVELTREEITFRKDLTKEVITGFDYGQPITTVKKANKKDNRMELSLNSETIRMTSYENPMNFRQSNRSEQFIHLAGKDTANDTNDKQQEYVQTGRLLHYIFSTIRTADDVERTLMQVETEGLIGEQKQRDHLRRLVENGLRRPIIADWFSGRYELFNECSILSADPDSGECIVRRPDRVMMAEDEIIVVDFKFGSSKPEYHEQVKEYMELLTGMYPQAHIRGYLWFVYTNKTEEV